MLTVELDAYPQSHIDLIRYWTGFYNDHRQTIVHGEMNPTLRLGHVPSVTFVGPQKRLSGLYEKIARITLETPASENSRF